jgi:hypothetical protein
MTGYMLAYGECWSCGQRFTFNPERVPSIPILPDGTIGHGGTREPICRNCVRIADPKREATGLELFNDSDEAYGPAETI